MTDSKKHKLLDQEWVAGLLLLAASLLAIALANSGLHQMVSDFLSNQHSFSLPLQGEVKISLTYFVNNGLMTFFFFLMGLEIKRELVAGSLNAAKAASLPFIAALGGVVVPALIYLGFNLNQPDHLSGWAVPCATDIAFAMAALSVLSRHVPTSLKIMLLTVAIIDDIVAIVIIALFYSGGINFAWLSSGLLVVLGLYTLQKKHVDTPLPYIILGTLLWVVFWKAGLHATLAGVITAFFVPMFVRKNNTTTSPLKTWQHKLHLPVVLIIMPLFGFVNAGVRLVDLTWADALSPLTLGIIAGLVIGKPIGIMGAVWVGEKLGWLTRLQGLTCRNLFIVGQLCGVGFTMSLYIGHLAFATSPVYFNEVKLAVMVASLTSIALAYTMFYLGRKK